MKKTNSVFLCIVMLLLLLTSPGMASPSDPISYYAVIASDPENPATYQIIPTDNFEEAATLPDSRMILVSSPEATDEPAEMDVGIDSGQVSDKTVIFSNVKYIGHIHCGELVLLGNAIVDTPAENIIISGISFEGDPLPALPEITLEAINTAREGAKLKYTITGTEIKDIDMNWQVHALEIEAGATLKIIGSEGEEGGPNRLVIEHSLVVSGTLNADEGQILELRNGRGNVQGLTLYDSDGLTPLDNIGNEHEEFEYIEEKWVKRQGGPPNGGEGPKITLNYESSEGTVFLGINGDPPRSEPTGDHFYNEGDNIQVDIEAHNGYIISSVRINGVEEDINPDSNRYEYQILNIQGDCTIEAVFSPTALEEYYIELYYDPQQGRVFVNGMYEDGQNNPIRITQESINVDIEAEEGYIISSVIINNGDPIEVDNRQYTIENITENTSIEIEFQLITYTITATAGAGGAITPSGVISEVAHDSDRQFVIIADNGYKIDRITVNGEDWGGHFNREFTLDLRHIRSDHTIEVSFSPIGDGSIHEVVVEVIGDGTVDAVGIADNIIPVEDGFDTTLTITPDSGYRILSVTTEMDDLTRTLVGNGDGTFSLTLTEVMEDTNLSITFVEENLEDLLCKSYAVLEEDVESEELLKNALVREFEYLGFAFDREKIWIDNIDTSEIGTKGYGTFEFRVEVDEEESDWQIAYIVPEFSDIIVKSEGSYNGTPIAEEDEIRIAHREDGENGLFSAPAMDSGTIEFIGPYHFHIEGWMGESISSFGESGVSKLTVIDSFYRIWLHLENRVAVPYHGHPNEEKRLNWFGFNLLQDDALCLFVDAKSEEGTQHTIQWSLNRYALLNYGEYVSEVFFGNDTFEIVVPEGNFGGINNISIETGDFQGYTITETEPGRKFEVFFKSDYYDRVTLDILINDNVHKQLTVHRVGVQIQKEVYNPERGPYVNLAHGTQNGTALDYYDGLYYKVFATYCIPDGGTTAPYGLYVTYTFADGTKTSEIITQPCDNPPENINAEEYIDGVFVYYGNAACCDYLIYAAEDDSNAPAKINVTVLKGNPLDTNAFEGVFFGSGAGVEWINE